MYSFDASLFNGMDLRLARDQITNVHHSLWDVYPVHSRELHDLFLIHCISYSCDLIYITVLLPVTVSFHPFDVLVWENQRSVVQDGYQVGVVGEHHRLNMLRSLYKSTDPAFIWVSDQLRVSYILRQNEGLWLPYNIIM